MERDEYDEMLRTLVRIAAHQDTINTAQRLVNERLAAAIERLDVTVAEVKNILTRLIEHSTNGREASRKGKRYIISFSTI